MVANKKVVYILGSPRTGSTLLDLMLSCGDGCVSVGELWLYKRRRQCGMCGTECAKWNKYMKRLQKPFFYRTAFEVFGGGVLVDSSKKHKWLNERAKHENYDYKVIHIVRNGLDRLLFKKKLEGKIDPSRVTRWIEAYKANKLLTERFRGITVKYEDICTDKGLKECCDFVGIEFKPEMKEFWKHEHHGLLGSRKTYSLVRQHHGLECERPDFVQSMGFQIKARTGHEFLDKEDLRIFKKMGGERLNKKLGYR